jgi:hypothetical protein
MLVSPPYTQGVRVVGVRVTATQKILIHQIVRIFFLLIPPHRSHTLIPVLTRA